MTRPTSWDALPLVLTLREVAGLFGFTPSTISRRCTSRTMRPAPLAWQKPYRWSRESVRRELETPTPAIVAQPTRPGQRRPAFARVADARARQMAERQSLTALVESSIPGGPR